MSDFIPKKSLTVWLLPVLFFAVQCLHEYVGFGIVVGLFLLSIFLKGIQKAALLAAFSICGYFVCFFISPLISASVDNSMLEQTLERFALVGYIVIFATWSAFSKNEVDYLARDDFITSGEFSRRKAGACCYCADIRPVPYFIRLFCLGMSDFCCRRGLYGRSGYCI